MALISFLRKKIRKRKKSWNLHDTKCLSNEWSDTNGNFKKLDFSCIAIKESTSWMQIPRSNSFSKKEWRTAVLSLYEDQLLCYYKNRNSDIEVYSSVIKTKSIESLIPKESYSSKEKIFLIEIRSKENNETTFAFKSCEERDGWMIAFLMAKSQSILRTCSSIGIMQLWKQSKWRELTKRRKRYVVLVSFCCSSGKKKLASVKKFNR